MQVLYTKWDIDVDGIAKIPLCAQNQKDLELSLLKEQIQKEKVLKPVLTETLMEKWGRICLAFFFFADNF